MTILLLSDVLPCKDFSGALLTEKMCGFILPHEKLVGAFVVGGDLYNFPFRSDMLSQIPFIKLFNPRQSPIRFKFKHKLFWLPNTILSICNEFYVNWCHIPTLSNKIVKYAKEHNVTQIWCILQGQTTIKLAYSVANKMKVDLFCQVWDHPSWWLMANHVDNWSTKKILEKYEKVLLQSKAIGAASENMADYYIKNFNKKAVSLISTLPVAYSRKCKDITNDREILIGVCGQLYARIEWDVFINALNQINWEIAGHSVKIRFLGHNSIAVNSHTKCNIEFLGYREQDEVLAILSECHVAYCAYPMKEEMSWVSKFSFPSKLSTYLASGLPVLFHGREDSAPAILINKYSCGIVVNNYHEINLLAALENLLNIEKHQEFCLNVSRAFKQNLTDDSLKSNTFKFLNMVES